MRILIDIDENVFTRLFDCGTEDMIDLDRIKACNAIRHGTPIPDNATVCDIDAIKDVQKWERVVSKAEVLEKIRAEIQHLADLELLNMKLVLQIIDKYTK